MKQTKTALMIMLVFSLLCCKTAGTSAGVSPELQAAAAKEPQVFSSFMDLVFVESGSFSMGSEEGNASEKPAHAVEVNGFYIGKYEVTQSQWIEIMGAKPILDKGAGDKNPIYNVSWSEAVDFCNKLSMKEGLTPCYTGSGAGTECNFSANGYRLPTEAEWEYAARGGNRSGKFLYAGSNNEEEAGWYSGNSGGATHEVGLKAPNELGLYDMSGNLWEWCWDWYDAKFYNSSPSKNPAGPDSGIYRVLRGGGWAIFANALRCTNRYYGAHRSDSSTGFRCVRAK